MDRTPVRGHEAFEADLVAQDFGQSGFVAAGERAIQAVVGAHDRRDAGLDGCVERGDIDLVQRLVIDVGAGAIGVVTDEVLDLGHDVLGLDALDLGRADLAGQEWIFAEGVVAAAELEVAIDVHKRLKGDVHAKRTIFAADHQTIVLSRLAAEGGGHTHGGGFALGRMAREHSRRPIGKAQPRNAETRNPGHVAGLSLIYRWIFMRAVDQRQLFIERHLAEQLVHPCVARDHGHALGQRHGRSQQETSGSHECPHRHGHFVRAQICCFLN